MKLPPNPLVAKLFPETNRAGLSAIFFILAGALWFLEFEEAAIASALLGIVIQPILIGILWILFIQMLKKKQKAARAAQAAPV